MQLWSQKLWEKIQSMGITEDIFDTVDSIRQRSDVLYNTDWSKDYQESVAKYCKRQLSIKAATDLVASKKSELSKLTNDDKIRYWLIWVINNISYLSDQKKFGTPDKWEDVDNILETKKADCESGATLLYTLCRLSGVPRSRLELNAGDVKTSKGTGGHCWLEARSEKDGYWRICDWCYWPNTLTLRLRPTSDDEPNYLNRWWSFDELKAYKGD